METSCAPCAPSALMRLSGRLLLTLVAAIKSLPPEGQRKTEFSLGGAEVVALG